MKRTSAVQRDQRDQGDQIVWCPTELGGCGKEVMIYNRRFRFWECPRCAFQAWPRGGKITALTEDDRAEIGADERIDADGPAERLYDHRTGKPILSYGYVPSHDARKRSSGKSGKRRKRKKFLRPRRWRDEGK